MTDSLMTTPRIDWTAVERNGVYYNFKGVTAEGLTLADRGWRPQVVGVDKPGDYRVKLFADTSGMEEGDVLEIQLREARLEFVCEADGLLQAGFADSSGFHALMAQPRPESSYGGAEAPTGMIDACLEGTFSTEIIDGGEFGGRCEGAFPDPPEWMGDGVRVFITPESYVSGGGTSLRVVCPNASQRVLGRLRHLRINGVWMEWMPYNYKRSRLDLYLMPDPRDADQIRDYEGEPIPNEAPPMRDTHNLRPFFYKYIPGARPYCNWTGEAAKIYGPWRKAVYEYQRYSHLGVTYGQWKLYKEAWSRELALADKKKAMAEREYQKRPPAYQGVSIDEFAEQTKDDQRFGAVMRHLDAARQAEARARQKYRMVADVYEARSVGYINYHTIDDFVEEVAKRNDPQYEAVGRWFSEAEKDETEAAEQRKLANDIYAIRPEAYIGYTIEKFAEETKYDERWGKVYRWRAEADAAYERARKAELIANNILYGSTGENGHSPGLVDCYEAKDKCDKILIAFEDEHRDQITAYFSM